MYKVIVFGTGNLSKILIQELDYSKIEIIAYLDNDKNKCGTYINKILVKSPNILMNINYDYILIASQYDKEIYNQLIQMNIDKKKIFQYSSFSNSIINYPKYKVKYFFNNNVEYNMLITGISYSMLGIKCNLLKVKSYSFALGSQDLYYDYKIIKHLLIECKVKTQNIRYCIIGLSYYSFEYDMSLSSMKSKVISYYELLKDYHNYYNFNNEIEVNIINNYIAELVLKKDEAGKFTKSFISSCLSSEENKDILGKQNAEKDCNKNYPKTVKQNKQIFKDYLKLLKDNNIKPIVVVFPASKYYTKYFSKRIEDEFHSIINEVKKEYDFQYIDYFRSELFDDEDFQDVSHLNSKGAEKFTNILNNIIEW